MKTTEQNPEKSMQEYLEREVIGRLLTSPLCKRFLNILEATEKYTGLFAQYQLLILTDKSETTKITTLIEWIKEEIAKLNKKEELGVMQDIATTMTKQQNEFSEGEKTAFNQIVAPEEKVKEVPHEIKLSGYKNFLSVKTLTGKEFPLERIFPSSTVAEAKEAIFEREGIPADQQRLIAHARSLSNDQKMLSDYEVEDGEEISLVLKLRGQ